MKTKPDGKPSKDTVWLKVELPKPLHKRLAKHAIDVEKTLPAVVLEILERHLPKF